jgi:hypothetical protein
MYSGAGNSTVESNASALSLLFGWCGARELGLSVLCCAVQDMEC